MLLEGAYELPAATVVVDGLWGEPADGCSPPRPPASGSSSSASPPARRRGSSPPGFGARRRGCSAMRSARRHPRYAAAGYRELCGHAREGRVRFDVETYELDRIAEAWERQASGSPGVKIVVELAR